MSEPGKLDIDRLREHLRKQVAMCEASLKKAQARLAVVDSLDSMPLAERVAFADEIAAGYESMYETTMATKLGPEDE